MDFPSGSRVVNKRISSSPLPPVRWPWPAVIKKKRMRKNSIIGLLHKAPSKIIEPDHFHWIALSPLWFDEPLWSDGLQVATNFPLHARLSHHPRVFRHYQRRFVATQESGIRNDLKHGICVCRFSTAQRTLPMVCCRQWRLVLPKSPPIGTAAPLAST